MPRLWTPGDESGGGSDRSAPALRPEEISVALSEDKREVMLIVHAAKADFPIVITRQKASELQKLLKFTLG